MEPNKYDIFMGGLVCGMFLFVAATSINKWIELWLKKKDLELNATLGNAILEMQKKMNEGQNEKTN